MNGFMRRFWGKSGLLKPSTEPLIKGMTAAECQKEDREDEARLARGEWKEITPTQFRAALAMDVFCGIQLPNSADDWLRNHLYKMGDRPKAQEKSK